MPRESGELCRLYVGRAEAKGVDTKAGLSGPLGACAFLFGLLFLASLLGIRDGLNSSAWPATTGTVTSCQVGKKGGGQFLYIWYDYEVDQKYSSNRYWFGLEPGTLFDRHKPPVPRRGQQTRVYYDPTHPAKAVLEPGVVLSTLAMGIASLAMTVLCLLALLPLPGGVRRMLMGTAFVTALGGLATFVWCQASGA